MESLDYDDYVRPLERRMMVFLPCEVKKKPDFKQVFPKEYPCKKFFRGSGDSRWVRNFPRLFSRVYPADGAFGFLTPVGAGDKITSIFSAGCINHS